MSKPYPFTTVLDIMKPCKADKNKKSHVVKLEEAMTSDLYAFEEKIDGIGGVCIGGRMFSIKVSKVTGAPSEKTDHMPHLTSPLQEVMGDMIFHGEIYYPGKKSNHITSITGCDPAEGFARQVGGFLHTEDDCALLPEYAMNRRAETIQPGYLRYIVYDILRDIDGTWLVTMPYRKRRQLLEQRIGELAHVEHLDLVEVHYDNFQERLDDILMHGREGAVLKHLDKQYFPGKRPMWNQIKLKQEMTDDVIITGFAPPTRDYTGKNKDTWKYWEGVDPVTENYYRGLIGSITIGKYDGEKLVDLGTVTGLTDTLRRDMTDNQEKYIGTVIKIQAMEKSEYGVYRHANFVGWHPDKNAHECRLEEND